MVMAVTGSMAALAGSLKGLSLSSSSGSSFMNGGDEKSSRLISSSPIVNQLLTIEVAPKKVRTTGPTKNGRDSISTRSGVEIYGDQPAKPGAIIIHQHGTKGMVFGKKSQIRNENSASNGGWQLKAITSETVETGSAAGVDDEAEVLKRQELFNKIAPMYDNLNDWLSLGQHRVWKRMAVSWSRARAGHTVLDICCGSGDLSFLLAQKVGRSGKVIGLDFAKEQLSVAAEREQVSRWATAPVIEWIQGDALSLPFDDSSFDAITMGYGLRNVANIPQALAEIYRVLKPGKTASILDFNRSPDVLTNQVQGFMLDNVVVPVATYFGVQEEYAYLKTSIARFPSGAEQEQLATKEGFSEAVHYELAGGLMGVLVATK